MKLAAVGAGCSVSTASLLHPTTDLLVVAALPFILLGAARAIEHSKGSTASRSDPIATRWLMMAGVLAGLLFWVRYASVFVPVAVGVFLFAAYLCRRISLGRIVLFAACASVPIVTLLIINRVYGTTASLQGQLNLGQTVKLDLSMAQLMTAWWKFMDFGFYDYHWYSHWLFALWPAVAGGVAVCIRPTRRAIGGFLSTPGAALSTAVVIVLLMMLVGATAVFGDKYSFIDLDRYYTPARPLYMLLFVGPLLLIPRRMVRVAISVGLVIAASWTVQQEWPRPYARWLAANREATPYGAWGHCFSPHAADLYHWLEEQKSDDLIVVSNFHDYVAMETRIPAIPVPLDPTTLDTWIERICQARGITDPHILFVLDPDNHWREYFLSSPAEVVRVFDLHNRADAPAELSAMLFDYAVSDTMGESSTRRAGDRTFQVCRRH
ncbi:MAG: hypothetical protein IID41_15980 [Planctomycetes bacterium]|nr:hypothetical protein [Planctomycetota bacterium]